MLEHGLAVTGLTAENWKPWHLRATYQLLPAGSPPLAGTIEEWWAGPDHWRRTYTTADSTWTEWSVTRARRFETNRTFAYETLDQRIAWPLTTPLLQARYFKPEYQMDWKAMKAGVALDCVMMVNPTRYADGVDPDFLFPKLCFDPGGRLRLMGTSDTTVMFNKYQTFQDRAVAYKVDVILLGQKAAAMDVTLLEPLTSGSETMLKPDPNAVSQPYALTALDPRPVPTYQVGASYPTVAFLNREYGTVNVPVLIERDGRVKINGPAKATTQAQPAIDAIKTWRYEPYLIDGEPVELAASVSYNFDGRPFVPQTGAAKKVVAGGYDPKHDPQYDLKQAMLEASKSHKRILMEVGGDWCIWCTYLDKFFAEHGDLQNLLQSNYVLLKINMSTENRNREFLNQYPDIKGFPHIFVLDAEGKLLQSQDTNVLESGNGYGVGRMREFLNKWKPT